MANLQQNLKVDKCVLHWDGKIMPDIETRQDVDRLPIVLSASGQEILLGAPKIDSGTEENQASAIISVLSEWSIADSITALCFDTAAVNTGIHSGACVLVEQALRRELTYLPCRHHIIELVLRSAFETYWPTSSGPNVSIFTRFKNKWSDINQQKYTTGISDREVQEALADIKDEILILIANYLQISQPRGDYKELLDLALIFLGALPSDRVVFKYPGAVHHARWMAKAIYNLKIFMFRNQLKLTKTEIVGVRQICIFVIKFHIKAWFSATSAITAPSNDLMLIKNLLLDKKINSAVSKKTSEKMANHLWYLSEELAALALFDSRVSPEIKIRMIIGII
ncbi:uncharacterized protein LOC123271871 isoform X1 [Cotesia glomerata]|uniref:uncharacterized protein LOC123271871 isoform X1 n=1 Tax=Cotesia glomerata TaxID=32391 RepID=UPI001D02FD75|nr:uncharacterized protein LOC123271871 isoform X1 [Cotesia glomerata]